MGAANPEPNHVVGGVGVLQDISSLQEGEGTED